MSRRKGGGAWVAWSSRVGGTLLACGWSAERVQFALCPRDVYIPAMLNIAPWTRVNFALEHTTRTAVKTADKVGAFKHM